MMREMPQQKAIFAENTALGTQTLDIHPLFLAAAAREIPLIVPWIWPKEDTVNLFNDRVSFYTDKSGAEKMAAEVEQAEKKQDIRLPVQKRAAKAALLARREYSAESAGKRVRQALAMQPDQYKRPGSIFLPTSIGCHSLIKSGAQLVDRPEDILESLKLASFPQQPVLFGSDNGEDELDDNAKAVLKILSFEPLSLEEILEKSGLGLAEAGMGLLDLEMRGKVAQTAARSYYLL